MTVTFRARKICIFVWRCSNTQYRYGSRSNEYLGARIPTFETRCSTLTDARTGPGTDTALRTALHNLSLLSAPREYRTRHVGGSDYTSGLNCVLGPATQFYLTARLDGFCELGRTWPPPHDPTTMGTLQFLTQHALEDSDRSEEHRTWVPAVTASQSAQKRWLAHCHHGSRHFRVSRVGSGVPGSVCEYATGTRTEQRGRGRRSTPACASWAVRTCGVTCDTAPRHCRMRSHRSRRRNRRGQ